MGRIRAIRLMKEEVEASQRSSVCTNVSFKQVYVFATQFEAFSLARLA
jgi:hypothetical protein